MTRDGIKVEVAKWGQAAKIGKLSPHDFRRSFATMATLMGAPQRIAKLGGRWKDDKTFECYVRHIALKDMEPYYPITAIETRKYPPG